MFKRQFNITKHPQGGWFVSVFVLPGSDEMWTQYRHPAVFKDIERAKRFMARIQYKPINLANWIGEDWVCSPLRVDESKNPAPYCVL